MATVDPRRGELWIINFDPSVGQEIRKERPAIVMNIKRAGRLALRMVVPITSGYAEFNRLFWMVNIEADSTNGLDHDSFADAFQFKSVSIDRFALKLGVISDSTKLREIASAIVLCIGYSPPNSSQQR